MKDDVTVLSEVVVYTGYMTQKKADLTGSISIAGASDIEKSPSVNAMKSLQGKLLGVHITTSGGNPSEGVNVQIRGLSSLSGAVKPLIVLDEMPTENLDLRDINSGDIESIQVLKDAASASIYGAHASGGVLLVQTKKVKRISYPSNTMAVLLQNPQKVKYNSNTRGHWKYYGDIATQLWYNPNPDNDMLRLVDERYTYWASKAPIPGGISFENFELKAPLKNGEKFYFGVVPMSPEKLIEKNKIK